jgi:branched-chain amino acid transport system ATP-binding protein
MGNPDLVIINEPTKGLAPKLVEQKLTIALKISCRLYALGHARIVFAGSSAGLAANAAVRKKSLEA